MRLSARDLGRAQHVWRIGEPGYPIRDEVPERPEILLGEGDAADDAFEARRVAIVGTRASTKQGEADAREIIAALVAAAANPARPLIRPVQRRPFSVSGPLSSARSLEATG